MSAVVKKLHDAWNQSGFPLLTWQGGAITLPRVLFNDCLMSFPITASCPFQSLPRVLSNHCLVSFPITASCPFQSLP